MSSANDNGGNGTHGGNGTSKPSGNGRNSDGKFAPGNRIAKGGNVFARRASELRAKLYAAVTDEDWRQIVHSLIKQAKDGKMWAIQTLFDRLLGKADQKVEVSGSFSLAEAIAAIAAEEPPSRV